MPIALQLSLIDTAELARVERPVVSMWRTRAATSDLPFPSPLANVAGEERFDVDAVVRWLEATGRGKNPDVRADAPAYALPAGISLRSEPQLLAGLTALLCLKVDRGVDLAGLFTSALQKLATQADPEDRLLRRELDGLGAHLETMATYADYLADAAFGAAQAFERLLAQRYRHASVEAVKSAVAPPLHDLVVAVARSLARDCGVEPPRYVDPTGAGGDLFLSVVRADAEQNPDVFTSAGDTPSARLFRRRLRVHDFHVEPVPDAMASLGDAVLVAQFPPSGRPDMTEEEIIGAIDEIAVSMGDRQRAVLVAPASLLVDRPRNTSLQPLRSHVLRAGRVRAMVRLRAGLVPHRSRQALALWLLSPDFEQHAPDKRRIAAIDVSDEPLTELLIGQIRDDVVAAMAEPRLSHAHSYARARLVTTASVLAQSGALLPPRRLVSRADDDPAAAALVVQRLRIDSRPAADALGGAGVAIGDSRASTPIPLGDASRLRFLRVLAGNRHGFDLVRDGNVPVIGIPELIADDSVIGRRRVDRLTFLGTYGAARLTEPGDVVFGTSPRPCAVVDEAGGSAVQHPARVVRVVPMRGEGLSPHVIAHAVNSQPAASRAWRNWLLPRVAADQVVPVTDSLRALRQEQTAVRARLAELADLERTVVWGVMSGSLVLRTTIPTRTPR